MFQKEVVVFLTLVCLVVADAASNTMSPECKTARKNAFNTRRLCFESTIKNVLNGTAAGAGSCKRPQDIQTAFTDSFKNISASCWKNDKEIEQVLKNITRLRTFLIQKIFEGNNLKDFFGSGGLECIKSNGQEIFKTCIVGKGSFSKNESALMNATLKILPLEIDSPTCSRQQSIVNCTRELLSGKCNTSTINFMMTLHESANKEFCAPIEAGKVVIKSKSKSGAMLGIILGVCGIIIVLVIVAVIVIKKKCTRSDPQTYNVEFSGPQGK